MLQLILEALHLRTVRVRTGYISTPKEAKSRDGGPIPDKAVAIELSIRDVIKTYRMICDPITFTKFAYKIVDIDTTKPYKVDPPFGNGKIVLPAWCLKEVQRQSFEYGKIIIDSWKKYEVHKNKMSDMLKQAGASDEIIEKLIPQDNPWNDGEGDAPKTLH